MQNVVRNLKKNWIRNGLITLYVLLVLGISATARAQIQTLPIFVDGNTPVLTDLYQGQVAVTLDGQAYLVVSENEFYKLASNIELAAFNGANVIVEAYELQYRVGPVIEVKSLDPLQEPSRKTRVAPVLVVLGITEAQ
jgi:hypothetical protein